MFDSKLTFLPHVLYFWKKCERSLNILKVLSNTLWGSDSVSLLRVYQALILSRLDYGCVVYGSARASVLKRLDTINHSALRICCGAFRTSPVNQLVCGMPSTTFRTKAEAIKCKLFYSCHVCSFSSIKTLCFCYSSQPTL
ncbi:putative RNA-directed DNA polymerase from transposon X-element [Trichonephila clavipes]|nr:putative RNA-directed DNA polymerase from transposon X-element [Trichonephila clavipes]